MCWSMIEQSCSGANDIGLDILGGRERIIGTKDSSLVVE